MKKTDKLIALNLRGFPADVKQALKVAAAANNMTLTAFCLETLRLGVPLTLKNLGLQERKK